MAHGINGNGLILHPHDGFVRRLEVAIGDQRLVDALKPYLLSMDHKLNVARYSAGLILAMKPSDYGWHRFKRGSEKSPTKAEYPDRCIYYAHDWDQYALGLLFSIESFASSSFSLFDSCGHLLKEIFNLELPREVLRSDPNNPGQSKNVRLEISFVNAIDDLHTADALKLYNFLRHFHPGDNNCLDWVNKLRKIRNHTTHAQVTDVVELRIPTIPNSEELWLFGKIFGKNPQGKDQPDIILREFTQECFDGLEMFVEQLYEKLAILAEGEKSLPLSPGRYDDQI